MSNFRHPAVASNSLFSMYCIWSLHCMPTYASDVMAAMQSIATTETWAKQHYDDLEDREISKAGVHGVYLNRAH